MKWYHIMAAFFSGLFISNAIPHFVNGISGNGFPTPFANPPGKGLSSPMVNVIWALFNFLVGYILMLSSQMLTLKGRSKWILRITFFVGFSTIAIMLSFAFATKLKA